jgi:hypothetical protein
VFPLESTDNRYERASIARERGRHRKGPGEIAYSLRGDLARECVFSRDTDIRFPRGGQ